MTLGECALQHLGIGPCEPELAFLRAGHRSYFGLPPDEARAGASSPPRIFEIARLNKVAGFLAAEISRRLFDRAQSARQMRITG
jgi:hypothetical protein